MSEEVKKENTNPKDLTAEIKDLVVEFRTDYGVVQALNSMELEIERGKTLGLVGETGAGKTTTGLSLLRLIPDPPGVIVKGSIKLDGKDILSMSDKEMQDIRGKAVAMIFQDPMTSLDPVMTVENQIAEVIKLHEEGGMEHALTRAREMLELVGIPGSRGSEYPHQFSGGMKQRVVIAMALACNPELLIADEPTTALDVTIQAQIVRLMKQLQETSGTAIILITHDMGIVAEMADEIMVMYAGNVVEKASKRELFQEPLHPYTKGLLASIPSLGKDVERLYTIEGVVPGLQEMPCGCRFYDRCQSAMPVCKEKNPGLCERNGRQVRCFLYEEGRGLRQNEQRGEPYSG